MSNLLTILDYTIPEEVSVIKCFLNAYIINSIYYDGGKL